MYNHSKWILPQAVYWLFCLALQCFADYFVWLPSACMFSVLLHYFAFCVLLIILSGSLQCVADYFVWISAVACVECWLFVLSDSLSVLLPICLALFLEFMPVLIILSGSLQCITHYFVWLPSVYITYYFVWLPLELSTFCGFCFPETRECFSYRQAQNKHFVPAFRKDKAKNPQTSVSSARYSCTSSLQ